MNSPEEKSHERRAVSLSASAASAAPTGPLPASLGVSRPVKSRRPSSFLQVDRWDRLTPLLAHLLNLFQHGLICLLFDMEAGPIAVDTEGMQTPRDPRSGQDD